MMKIFEIQTTSDSDQNFYLMTDINRITVETVIEEMVQEERAEDSKVFYMNDDYVDKLKQMFPKAILIQYNSIPLIEI